jgi:hypothetical protein
MRKVIALVTLLAAILTMAGSVEVKAQEAGFRRHLDARQVKE